MLLAVLAAAGERGIARERLADLLWPDAPAEAGRHNLEQALHLLRRYLGRDLILGPDPLRLSPDDLSVDLWEFDALAANDPMAAGALVRGEFLDGFRAQGVPGFQRWLETTRDEISGRVRDVLSRRALALEAEGRLTEAESAWRQVAARDEFSPAAQAGIARCLCRLGERVAAERQVAGWEAMVVREVDASRAAQLLEPVRMALTTPADPEPLRAPALPPPDPPRGADAALPAASRPRRWVAATLALVTAGAAYAVLRARVGGPTGQQGHPPGAAVAITPFIPGAGVDSGLAREFTELVAANFRAAGYAPVIVAGVSAPRATSTVVKGSLAAQPGGVTIAGSLVKVGQDPATVLLPGGRANSELAEDLVARLLTAGDGDLEQELERGTRASAMIAFLQGGQALARNDPEATLRVWRRALEIDSTFATAALMLLRLSEQTDGLDEPRAARLAWAARGSLRPVRRRLLEILWANYLAPDPRTLVISLQNLAGAQLSDQLVWEELGSAYETMGTVSGVVANPLAEARQAYARALSLDSTLWLASGRLEELAAIAGDPSALRRVGSVQSRSQADPAREMTLAFMRRDVPGLDRLRPRLPELRAVELWGVRRRALAAGFDLASAEAAQAVLLDSAQNERERVDAAWGAYELALDEGRPSIAQRMAPHMLGEWSEETRLALRGLGALYWQDLSDSARAALAWLRDFGRRGADVPAAPDGRLLDALCAAEQARLDVGDRSIAPRTLRRLTADQGAGWPPWLRLVAAQCAAFLTVRLEPDSGPGRRTALERLDSLASRGAGCWCLAIHDVTAREWARLGDPERALRAIRRRSPLTVRLLAPAKRDEGSWALAVGDTAGALRAWRHYLALRSVPEPGLRPERDSVLLRFTGLQAAFRLQSSIDRRK